MKSGGSLSKELHGDEDDPNRLSRSFDMRGDGNGLSDFVKRRNPAAMSDRPKMSIMKGTVRPREYTRCDRNGATIAKETKQKYKISFADTITNDKDKIADVYMVESYKRFNAENTHGMQQGCCIIV